MSSLISLILEHTLVVFAVLDVVLGVTIMRGPRRKQKDNVLFAVYSLFGAAWCLGFGELIVQTDYSVAFMCRCVGIVGVFGSLISAMMLFACWSKLPKAVNATFQIYAMLGLIVLPMNCRPQYIQFIEAPFGLSYQFTDKLWSTIYNIYDVGLGVIFLIHIISMVVKTRKKRLNRMAKLFICALVCILGGSVFDTFLPMLGFAAWPVSTFTQFFGTLFVYSAVCYSNRNTVSILNSTEYIFHSLNSAILIYDTEGRMIAASDEAKNYLQMGDTEGEFVNLRQLFEIDYDPMLSLKERKTEFESVVRKTGASCNVFIEELFDDYEDRIGYLVVIYDTTEHSRFIAELESARRRADEANKAKTSFLANMSHEIRTPINTVLGMNEMIRRESDSKAVLSYSENIRSSGEALLAIINDILDFSKVEAGMMEIVEENYSLRELLSGLVEMFTLKCHEKGLEFKSEVESNIPSGLYGDEVRIRQILINLLSNAVKYTHHGGVTLRVQECRRTGGEGVSGECTISFEVIDTGIGIRPEDKNDLFGSFTRLDYKQTHHIEGTGLGLSIVKELSRLMDGELSVESKYGSGSNFKFVVAQRITDSEPIGDINRVDETTIASYKNYKERFVAPDASILVVDDNKMNLAVIQGLLKKTKVRLTLVESGEEALEAVRKQVYHLILLDHMMPVMDGIETLQKLKTMPITENLSYEAPVIVLTANAIHGAREMYLANGFKDYLSKPVESRKLEEMIDRYLPDSLKVAAAEEPQTPAKAVEEPKSSVLIEEDGDAYTGPVRSEEENVAEALKGFGISLKRGLEFCETLDIYKVTADAFCDLVPEATENLRKFRTEKDVDNYRILIHAIKSNARTLGCEELFEYALSQENLCKEGNFEPVVADGDKPEKDIRKLAEVLNAVFINSGDEGDLAEAPVMSRDELHGLCNEIIEYLDGFDDIAATERIDMILKASLPEEVRQLAEKALGRLKQFVYDEAAEFVKEILKVDF